MIRPTASFSNACKVTIMIILGIIAFVLYFPSLGHSFRPWNKLGNLFFEEWS